MLQKKVCLIGTSAVGKTSLVARFVTSLFSEKYLTTIGVKIDKKILTVEDTEVTLMIWDLAGVDEFQSLNDSYLRGSGGYMLVADGTRRETLDRALDIQQTVVHSIGHVPFVLAMNKVDLRPQWSVSPERMSALTSRGYHVQPTSAKTGEGVEAAFQTLARLMTT